MVPKLVGCVLPARKALLPAPLRRERGEASNIILRIVLGMGGVFGGCFFTLTSFGVLGVLEALPRAPYASKHVFLKWTFL